MENNFYNNGIDNTNTNTVAEVAQTTESIKTIKEKKLETKREKLLAKMTEAKRRLKEEQDAIKAKFEKEEQDLKNQLDKELEIENKKLVLEIRKFWESNLDISELQSVIEKVIGLRN
ncbi:hypothetical protein [Aliarcobacter butzleri]|uniref:hypothetical protein n=1 Tax=Aliarcobacter butzleri TaxID=28197 RepID=UPI0021B1A26A|nr:hypothetical protein [Aliarcobacter butzleri]MCT7596117.1 hypothetical protein [Aliarcobacter butzleri]